MLINDPVSAFAGTIAKDIGARLDPIPDGQIHRFDDPEGKRHNRACWYVIHLDGIPAGAYGNWRTGFQSTWRADTSRGLDPAEHARIDAMLRAAREKRERERLDNHTKASRRAAILWNDAVPATVGHPYLARKRITALGLRQAGELLLVPLADIGGNLLNLQKINPRGDKRFLSGGRITGCFALAGAQEIPEVGEVYIAEGWATASSIYQTLHVPVVAAMTAGNLLPVAQAIRARRPNLEIVVAADDDHRTPGNPGIRRALEAASAVHGAVTWPTVCRQQNCECSDFNDAVNCERAPT